MKIKYLFLFIALPLMFIRCIDEIDLNIDTDQQKLVVDGQITDSLQLHTVRVNYSAVIGVGTDNIMTPIPNAKVKVVDDNGVVVDFPEIEPGVYGAESKGEVGRSYHIEIELPDGRKIMSHPSLLGASPAIGAVSVEVIDESSLSSTGNVLTNERLELSMNLDVSSLMERPYLRWRAEGEWELRENYPGIVNTRFCYVKNRVDINQIKVFDTNELSGGILEEEPFLNTDYNYRFGTQYCFHLFQYSISEEEYNYWNQVAEIVNIDGSLFDPPPGTVKGNLFNPDDSSDFITGYFSVAGVSFRREFMNATSIGRFVEPRCHGLGFRQTPSECYDCTSAIGSTLIKPAYWP